MGTYFALALLTSLLCLALTAGSARSSHHDNVRMDKLAHLRGSLNTIRANKCLPPMQYRWKVWEVPYLAYVIEQTVTWIHDARDASSRCTPWYVTKQIWAGNILGRESAGDPWPNCPDPWDGSGSTWMDTVACENRRYFELYGYPRAFLDSPGFYRCGLQFHPDWERRFGRLCP